MMARGTTRARQHACVLFGVPSVDVDLTGGRAHRCGMPLALRAQSLWKSYAAGVAGCSARIWVLRGATFEVHDGECVAILGARGAGTTTLLHCLAGVRRMDAGTIEHRRPPLLFAGPDAASIQPAPSCPRDILLVDEAVHPGGTTVIPRAVSEPLERGVTTIIAAHELSRIRHLVDRVLLLRDGRITSLPLRSGSRRVAERSAAETSHRSRELEASRRPTTINR
jgi:ABC-type multidrug transport system ATPase subunit